MKEADPQTAIISPFVLVPETVTMTGCPRSTILKYSKIGQSLKQFDYLAIALRSVVLMFKTG